MFDTAMRMISLEMCGSQCVKNLNFDSVGIRRLPIPHSSSADRVSDFYFIEKLRRSPGIRPPLDISLSVQL